MRNANALVKRLTDTLADAAEAVTRGADDLLAALLPKPQAQLVPVRVRRTDPQRR